jgi:predicted MFS family arabinose efflux permease
VPDSLTMTKDAPARLTRTLVLVFAAACGLAVANLYYAQPILDTVARSFGASAGTAGLIVTFSQIGYAAGLALLVPLGDLLTRRRLLPAMLAVTAAALVLSAAAPGIGVLIGAALLVGTGSVAAQLLIPMAASLADDARRGQIVGTVMSGLLLGILLARTVSGALAELAGWRVVYLMAAIATLLTAAVLWFVLPAEPDRPRLRYGTLLMTTVRLFLTEPLLRRRAGFGALGFAAFSVLWTTVAFLLSGPPYHYGDAVIGLFGLVGAGGALAANFAGRWADRELGRATTLVFAACIGLSFLPLWYGRHSLAMLIAGILLLDVGVQGLQVTNQSLVYRLAPQAHSRINSAYMLGYFAGGAVGSAVAASVYGSHRWAGVCLLGAAIGAVAVLAALAGAVPRPRAARSGVARPGGPGSGGAG